MNMSFAQVEIDRTGSLAGFESALEKIVTSGAKSVMIFSCDKNDLGKSATDKILKKIEIPVLGGLFPSLFFDKESLDIGTMVIGWPEQLDVRVIPDISSVNIDYEKEVESRVASGGTCNTMFVWVDGFSDGISALIDSLFVIFGLEHNYFGGGAGSVRTMKSSPCIFTNDGVLSNAATVTFSQTESSIRARHGFYPIHGPLRVTKAIGNKLYELNFRPAAEVYMEIVMAHSGWSIGYENFSEAAKFYPFGISDLGENRVVREPFGLDKDGSLICAGNLVEGSMLDVLYGNEQSLLDAASEASQIQSCLKDSSQSRLTMLVDCISRTWLLGPRFSEELAMVGKIHQLIGVCTFGEIAGNRREHLVFNNKTCVVGAMDIK